MPYSNLSKDAFWKLTLEDAEHCLSALYTPKFALVSGMRVSTAGSCFAQHFRRFVLRSDLAYVDMEPPPAHMPDAVARQFGYQAYSARFANIYTSRQLLQLMQDAQSDDLRDAAIWEQDGRWFDGLRPNVEPTGLTTRRELELHRRSHLRRVREMIVQSDVFVFTLDLTECWQDTASGTVFPMAPGTVAGSFDPERHSFVNLGIVDVIEDLYSVIDLMRTWNPDLQILLTVSPVPLTATASGVHVVKATTYSKSVLRVAADEIARSYDFVDYVPSYEIITSPMFKSQFFAPNMRSVTDAGVNTVMSTFFGAHPGVWVSDSPSAQVARGSDAGSDEDDLICEEVLLEEFTRK